MSERKLNGWIFSDLKTRLFEPGAIQRFRDQFLAAVAAGAKAKPSMTFDLDREIAATERTVANLADALGRTGFSDAVGNKLRTGEDHLRLLGAGRAEVAAEKSRGPAVPSEDAIRKYLTALFKALDEDPEKARALLTAHFEPYPLVLSPKNEGPERFYEASGAFYLWTSEVLGKSSCGGQIIDLQRHSVRLQTRILIGRKFARRSG